MIPVNRVRNLITRRVTMKFITSIDGMTKKTAMRTNRPSLRLMIISRVNSHNRISLDRILRSLKNHVARRLH